MEDIRKGPFIHLTCFFAGGILLAKYFPQGAGIWLLAAVVSTILLFRGFGKQMKYLGLFFLLTALFLGAFWYTLGRLPEGHYKKYLGQEVAGQGKVVSFPSQGENTVSLLLDIKGIHIGHQNIPGPERILLTLYNRKNIPGQDLVPGVFLSFRGTLLLPNSARNPGQFSYQEFLAGRHIFYQVKGTLTGNSTLKNSSSYQSMLAQLRQKIVRHLHTFLPRRERGLLIGLLFGDVSEITADEYEGYQRGGIVHLFCVSGFHVGIVLSVIWGLLSWLKIRPLWRYLWSLVALAVFFLLVGWTSSLVRASIMGVLGLGTLLVYRRRNLYNTMALAAFFILIVYPGELFQAGFQMSFAAVGGIFYLTPYFMARGWGRLLSPSLAAQLAILPLTAYHFNMISLIAPFLNILALMVGGISVLLAMIGFITSLIFPLASYPPLIGAGSLMYYLSSFTIWCSDFKWAAVQVPSPNPLVVIFYYILLILLPFQGRFLFFLKYFFTKLTIRVKTVIASMLILAVVVSLFYITTPDPMEVVFLDVGQGDSIFIRTPGGCTVLLDGGGTPQSDFQVGTSIVAPYLLHRGIKKIDLMIMTHNHLDHSEGLQELLSLLEVDYFLLPPLEKNDKVEGEILQLCQENHVPVKVISAGYRIPLEKDIFMEILHPWKGDNTSGNNHSLVLRVVFGKTEWLLTGDIENPAISNSLLKNNQLGADILKLPHHGSLTSYNPDFYGKVQPKAVVVSGGNNYEIKSPIRDYFNIRKIPLYTTREGGAIITKSDGHKISIRAFLANT